LPWLCVTPHLRTPGTPLSDATPSIDTPPTHWHAATGFNELALASAQPGDLAGSKGKLSCVAAHACGFKWDLGDPSLEPILEPATAFRMMRGFKLLSIDAEEQRVAREAALAARAAAALQAAAALADRARALRGVIVERDLYLRCPRCAKEFDDYEGCNALACGNCAARFCAVCLKDCGDDAHPHVSDTACGPSLHDRQKHERAKRARFLGRVVAAVRALGAEPNGAELQRAVVAELAKADLRDQGITEAEVLAGAGLLARHAGGGGGGGGGGDGGGGVPRQAAHRAPAPLRVNRFRDLALVELLRVRFAAYLIDGPALQDAQEATSQRARELYYWGVFHVRSWWPLAAFIAVSYILSFFGLWFTWMPTAFAFLCALLPGDVGRSLVLGIINPFASGLDPLLFLKPNTLGFKGTVATFTLAGALLALRWRSGMAAVLAATWSFVCGWLPALGHQRPLSLLELAWLTLQSEVLMVCAGVLLRWAPVSFAAWLCAGLLLWSALYVLCGIDLHNRTWAYDFSDSTKEQLFGLLFLLTVGLLTIEGLFPSTLVARMTPAALQWFTLGAAGFVLWKTESSANMGPDENLAAAARAAQEDAVVADGGDAGSVASAIPRRGLLGSDGTILAIPALSLAVVSAALGMSPIVVLLRLIIAGGFFSGVSAAAALGCLLVYIKFGVNLCRRAGPAGAADGAENLLGGVFRVVGTDAAFFAQLLMTLSAYLFCFLSATPTAWLWAHFLAACSWLACTRYSGPRVAHRALTREEVAKVDARARDTALASFAVVFTILVVAACMPATSKWLASFSARALAPAAAMLAAAAGGAMSAVATAAESTRSTVALLTTRVLALVRF
jgi:hypothetical protein